MKMISLEELEMLEEREDVVNLENNGVSGRDGSSVWFTITYQDGTEEDLYVA